MQDFPGGNPPNPNQNQTPNPAPFDGWEDAALQTAQGPAVSPSPAGAASGPATPQPAAAAPGQMNTGPALHGAAPSGGKKRRPSFEGARAPKAAKSAARAPQPRRQAPTGATAHGAQNGAAHTAPTGGAAAATRQRPYPFGLTQKQLRISAIAGSVVVVLILSILLAVFIPGCQAQPAASSSGDPFSSIASSSEESSSYNMADFSLPVMEYEGTVLGLSDEADDEYLAETLFLGDSNTERMLFFPDVTGADMTNTIGISSMGITSVTSLKCVKFRGMSATTMPNAVKIMQPRRVVINFGTNNAGMNIESFTASYKKAIEAIQEAYPAADIIIASIFPIAQGCTYGSISMSHIDKMNTALLELADQMDLKFLNWSEALRDSKTGYAKAGTMDSDGVHLNSKGMAAIFEYFRTHSYITEDTRPKPLQAVPVREATPEGLFPKPSSSSSQAGILVPQVTDINKPPEGWTVTVTEIENSAEAGSIIGQEPVAGTTLAEGASKVITVFIAKAKGYVVPNVAGYTIEQALKNNPGWTITQIATDYSDTLPAGTIIWQEQLHGTTASTAYVGVCVSLGPKPVESVPTPPASSSTPPPQESSSEQQSSSQQTEGGGEQTGGEQPGGEQTGTEGEAAPAAGEGA